MDGTQYSGTTKMNIFRQHSKTEIPELFDLCCEKMVGVGLNLSSGMTIFFISISGVMYKFFIDEGVLFWETSVQNREEDLIEEGDVYIDLMSYFVIEPMSKFKSVNMVDGVLTISFIDCGLVFVSRDDLTFVERV